MELHLNASTLSDPKSLRPFVSLLSYDISDVPCLLDSGSTHCFIDSAFIEKHKIPMYSVPLIMLCLFDGSSNSSIISAVDLSLTFTSGDTTSDTFFVASLDSSYMIVLGHCWLARYNPLIDWAMSSIIFQACTTEMPTPTSPLLSPKIDVRTSNTLLATLETTPPESPKAPRLMCLKISFINTAALQHACKLEGSVQFTLSLNSVSARSAALSDSLSPKETINLTGVPSEYHNFTDIFSKKKANTLAPHRPFDLKIELEEGASPLIGRLYSLSLNEQESLWDFLNEHLNYGFIQQSSSPHAAPVLFIRKKDSSLRLCVDFRGLNKITKKDLYPLPRTSDLLEAPSGVKIYTKLDLRHVYYISSLHCQRR